MTPKTFLENFRHVINAPAGITRVRELVIELGVSGRLNTSTDSSFVVPPEYDGEPGSTLFPGNWRLLNFGKFFDIQGGNQPPKSRFVSKPQPGYVQLFQIRDLGERGVPTYIPIDSTNRFCKAGDILIGRYGASVGKVFWAQDGAYNVALAKFIYPQSAYVPSFAFLMLRCSVFQRVVLNISRSAQAGFNKGDLVGINFPLPPLEEQKRIVAKVDELMRLCDRLEAQQQEREKLLPLLSRANHTRFVTEPTIGSLQAIFHQPGAALPSELRKSILELAVRGVLVPQMEPADSVDDLLESIATERQAVGRRESALIPSPSPVDTLRFDIPPTWRWQELDRLLIAGPTNGISPKAVEMETPVRSLTLSATTSGRFRGEHTKFISNEVPPDSDLWLEDGDILVQRGNTAEYVGVPAVYHGAPRSYIYPDLMMRIRVAKALDVDFIHLAMSAEPLRNFLRERATGTAGTMPKINHGTLKSLPIPIPPLTEQQQIVARVAQFMAIIDRLDHQSKEKLKVAETFAKAAVAAITSTEFTENERMKPPKTEVVTALKVGKKPKKPGAALLATLLSEQKAEASAKTLWQLSGLEIDAFYLQLKTEMANGWIDEDKDKRAVMEVEDR